MTAKAETTQFLLIAGERGSGKSAIVSEWAQNLRNQGIPIFALRAEYLDYPHLEAVLGALRIEEPISEIANRLALLPRKILVLESVEKLLEIERTGALTDLMQFLRKDQTWTVVASGRDYAYQQVTASFLVSIGTSWETVVVPRFSADELRSLVLQLPALAPLWSNADLRDIVSTPKMAELAFRTVYAGAQFSESDGEEEFRNAVWREVIAKEGEQRDGIHLARRNTFIDVAVARAQKMAFDVPVAPFHLPAVQALHRDALLQYDTRHGTVRPMDDVLEDWALDEYIEEKFREHSDDLVALLGAVGGEPAMRRAFRLWLHRKLRADDSGTGEITQFVLDAIRTADVPANWRDEVVTAVLQGENVQDFLNSPPQERLQAD